MAVSFTQVASGGVPATESPLGMPIELVANGPPLTFVASGGVPVLTVAGGSITELLMTSRANLPGFNAYAGSDGADTNSNSRISFYNETGVAVSKFRAYFPNWRLTATTEADGYNDITITAAVEYPASTFTPILFGGSASKVVTNGTTAESDEVTLAIPADAQFWVRTYVVVAAAGRWPQGYTINTAAGKGELADFATGVDKTQSGTITNATATATRQGYGPAALKATAWTGTSRQVAIAAVGDSITFGSFGSVDARGNFGPYGNACATRAPFINMGYTGTTAQANQPPSMTRRLAFLDQIGVTHVIVGWGINDLRASRSAANAMADLTAIHTAIAALGLKVIQTTMTTEATSTDGFETLANQTVKTTPSGVYTGGDASIRGVLNAAIRAKPAPLYDVLDVGDACEPSRNNGKFLTNESGNIRLRAFQTGTVVSYANPAITSNLNLDANSLAFGGSILWLTGVNAGIRSLVQSNGGATVTLTAAAVTALAGTPQAGDTFSTRFLASRFVSTDGLHPTGSIVNSVGYGGQYVMGDVLVAKMAGW